MSALGRMPPATDLRSRLVDTALEWERRFGVAPAITSAISEYDAAQLVGMSEAEFEADRVRQTAVTAGTDFRFRGVRYQVKASRPSGKPGSFVTLVNPARNYDWDRLIWILYDQRYRIVEAWQWDVAAYRTSLGPLSRHSPKLLRGGSRLFPVSQSGPA